jgi:beta-lactamase class A
MNKKTTLILLLLLIALISFYAGKQYSSDDSNITSYGETRTDTIESSFTNPLLECSFGPDYIAQNTIRPTKKHLEDFIRDKIASQDISHASVYYRDLNNGPWLGINETESFFPASLMKVPLVMYFYKKSEDIPGLLDNLIVPKKDTSEIETTQHFKPSRLIDVTKPQPIRSLIEASLKYSDNRAAETLALSAEKGGFRDLLNDLHLQLPEDAEGDYMNVRDYATFFRVLFNASYLSKHNSEEILSLLANTEFNKGLTKYLPKDIPVSHKFGERYSDLSNIKQFHDCGIVYLTYHPYLICIMTRSTNMDKAAEVAATLSRMIYREVTEQITRKK